MVNITKVRSCMSSSLEMISTVKQLQVIAQILAVSVVMKDL